MTIHIPLWIVYVLAAGLICGALAFVLFLFALWRQWRDFGNYWGW